MKIRGENLVDYLITLQLIKAGYHITYDEILEQTQIKTFLSVPKEDLLRYAKGEIDETHLSPHFRWYNEYYINSKQYDEWKEEALKIISKSLNITKYRAEYNVGAIDLLYGLKMK
jgi:hypothetical protein